MRFTVLSCVAFFIFLGSSTMVEAHNGRRFAIVVNENQLAVQGFLSTGVAANDEGGNPRPYYNALHDHWDNVGPVAKADLPGFDVLSDAQVAEFGMKSPAAALAGGELSLTLVGAHKWTSPSHMGPLVLSPMTAGDPVITVSLNSDPLAEISTATFATTGPNSLLLTSTVDAVAGAGDLDLDYEIESNPSGVIYALEWILSTDVLGIESSDSIYTLLSPDPDPTNSGTPNGMIGLHHPSLHLERHLGVAIVPEPATAWLMVVCSVGFLAGRRLTAK